MSWVFDFLSRRKVFAIYLIILFLGAIVPLGNTASEILMDNFTLEIRWDYLLHAMAYMPLPLLLMLCFRKHKALSLWILIGLVGFLVPVLFEMVQMIIPYRSFNINDMVANGVGVMLGLLPAVLVWRRIMP